MNEQAIIDAVEPPIEAAVSSVVETVEIIKNDPVVIAGAALIGVSMGALIGYRLAKKYLEPKYAALADEEIAKAKILYSHLNKEGFESPTVAVSKLIPDDYPEAQEAMARYQGKDVHLTVVEDGIVVSARLDQTENLIEDGIVTPPERRNLFDEDEPDLKYPGWDYEDELARRSDSEPYVVTQEEYFENEPNLETIHVTWYEGDEVLADDSDGLIGDIEGTVGRANLEKFGLASGEPHLVYVFNKKAGMGFEIARSEGKYAVLVMGFDDDEITERMPRRGRRLGD